MKLLWIAPIRFGDTIHQVGELGTAQALKKRGWSIDFVGANSSSDAELFMIQKSFNLYQVKMLKFPGLSGLSFNYFLKKKLPTLIKNMNYDVIIVEWQAALGYLKSMRIMSKENIIIPPWLFEDRSPPANNQILGRLQWLLYDLSWKKAAPKADAIEVLVPGLENFINQRFKLNLPVIYCPSGVDVDRFFNLNSPLGDCLNMVYHGSLDKERGLKNIIKFGKELEIKKILFKITVFGSGPLSTYFSEESTKNIWLDFKGRVDYDEVPKILSKHDIGLLPLPDKLPWNVGSPLKVMEYAASGLVTLATDVEGSLPFKNFDWFHMAPSSDPLPSWLKKIDLIIDERNEFITLRESARNTAESELTWDSAVKSLDQTLRSFLS